MVQTVLNQTVVCYFPMPQGQAEGVRSFLEGVGTAYGIHPVLLLPMDWNDDLTPWPSGPIFKKGKSFGGRSHAYLERLEKEIIPATEAGLGIVPEERWLVGLSLSGLFALWATAETSLFTRIGSVSGSFWYPGFPAWLSGQPLQVQSAYFSLGNQEASGRNPHLRSIASDTGEVVRILREKGVPTTFEWTEGTHFGPVFPRLERALHVLSEDAAGNRRMHFNGNSYI